MLRDNFIFEIPICIHQNLHNHVLFDVPVPDGQELSKMWKDFEREKPEFYDLGMRKVACHLYSPQNISKTMGIKSDSENKKE